MKLFLKDNLCFNTPVLSQEIDWLFRLGKLKKLKRYPVKPQFPESKIALSEIIQFNCVVSSLAAVSQLVC